MDATALLCFVSGLCLSVIGWAEIKVLPRILSICIGCALLFVVIQYPNNTLDAITSGMLLFNKSTALIANHFWTDLWPLIQWRGQFFAIAFICGKCIHVIARMSFKVILLTLATIGVMLVLYVIVSLYMYIKTTHVYSLFVSDKWDVTFITNLFSDVVYKQLLQLTGLDVNVFQNATTNQSTKQNDEL